MANTMADQAALLQALFEMWTDATNPRDKDIAWYAMDELEKNRWDISCCSPITRNAIKKAFE